MKEKLTRNIGVKIMSVLLAVLLWLVITNLDDPVRYKEFSDVQVTILNEDIIKTPNQSYVIAEGETIDFKVAARRSIIESLTESDFDVTADFAHLSSVNSVNINIKPRRYKDDIQIVDRGEVQYVIVSIEELLAKQFKVNIVEKGKAAEGYYLGPKSATPVMIEVTGPKSRIENIKQVVVEADVEGASKKVTQLLRPSCLDEEGNVIDASRLGFSSRYIEITMEYYPIKEIPLTITTVGQPADGYIMTNMEYQPKTIEIAAEASKLRSINMLEATYDITGANGRIEDYIELPEWLEEGVYLVGADTSASINVTIEKVETKELSIWPNDIELRNKPNSLDASYITKGPIKVNILGPASEIEPVTRNTLKPFINLSEYSSGTYYLYLETDISKNVSIDDASKVLLNLVVEP